MRRQNMQISGWYIETSLSSYEEKQGNGVRIGRRCQGSGRMGGSSFCCKDERQIHLCVLVDRTLLTEKSIGERKVDSCRAFEEATEGKM